MSILSDRIKKERENSKLTREELANKIGVSYSAIAMYERGEREPNNELTLKMCEIFNCSIDYLMGKSDFRNSLHVDIPKMLFRYKDYIKNSQIPEIKYEILTTTEKNILSEMFSDFANRVNGNKDVKSLSYYKTQINNEEHWNTVLGIFLIYMRYVHDVFSELNTTFSDNYTKKIGIKFSNENTINYSSQFYMAPIYGRISAGQPNWAEECVEGRLPIDPVLFNIINPEEHFFLRVNGESMNKVIRNGAYALIHKQDIVENGEIAVVLVNGDEATLKKFSKQGELIVLEPMSNDNSFQVQVYDKTTPIKVLGKYVGKFEMNK